MTFPLAIRSSFPASGSEVRSKARSLGKGVLLAGLAALSACGQLGDLFGGGGESMPCPRVSVLADASALTRFKPGIGRDILDVEYHGEISDIRSSCVYAVDDETDAGSVEVKIEAMIAAERGVANRDRKALFRYFVTVTDLKRNILKKQSFDVGAEFPGNHTRVTVADVPITLTLPFKKSEEVYDLQIYVGFQLTREELEFNRRRMQN